MIENFLKNEREFMKEIETKCYLKAERMREKRKKKSYYYSSSDSDGPLISVVNNTCRLLLALGTCN